MKKIILPIIAAATLNATDILNLPFPNAYDIFVCHMGNFSAGNASDIFEREITENNYQQTFYYIKNNLNYSKFQDVIHYTQILNKTDQYNNFNAFGHAIQNQISITQENLTVQNVTDLREEIDNFCTAFAVMYFAHQMPQR